MGVLDILVRFARPLPPPSPPSASPPAPRGLRGLRPRGQEAAPKARLAVLIGEHVAAHEAGSASVPRARGLVRVQSQRLGAGGLPDRGPCTPIARDSADEWWCWGQHVQHGEKRGGSGVVGKAVVQEVRLARGLQAWEGYGAREEVCVWQQR